MYESTPSLIALGGVTLDAPRLRLNRTTTHHPVVLTLGNKTLRHSPASPSLPTHPSITSNAMQLVEWLMPTSIHACILHACMYSINDSGACSEEANCCRNAKKRGLFVYTNISLYESLLFGVVNGGKWSKIERVPFPESQFPHNLRL